MRWRIAGIIFAAGIAATGAASGQSRNDNWARCKEAFSAPDTSIKACTAIIQSRQEAATTLALAFMNRGTAYYSKHEYDRAIRDYDQAIKLDPKNAAAFMNRGNVHDDKGQPDRAIRDYDQAIKLDPNNPAAFANRCLAYSSNREYDRAIQDCNQAIKLDLSYVPAFAYRGMAYSKKREYDQAIRDYDQAIKLDPNYAEAYYNRGIARRSLGQQAGADADFAKARQLNPDLQPPQLWSVGVFKAGGDLFCDAFAAGAASGTSYEFRFRRSKTGLLLIVSYDGAEIRPAQQVTVYQDDSPVATFASPNFQTFGDRNAIIISLDPRSVNFADLEKHKSMEVAEGDRRFDIALDPFADAMAACVNDMHWR